MMKKIITSAAVAAALTTVAFAGTASFTTKTYNVNFTSKQTNGYLDFYDAAADNNLSNQIIIKPTATVNNKNLIEVTLSSGATFNGTAENWKIITGTDGNITATGAQLSADKTTIKFIANEKTVPADVNSTLSYKIIGDYNLTIGSGATEDIKVSFTGKDNENDIVLDGVTSEVKLYTKEDKKPSMTLSCAKAIVDSTTGNTFIAAAATAAPAVTGTTVGCNTVFTAYTASDIDFDTSKVTAYLDFTSIPYADGNITITSFNDNNTANKITTTTDGLRVSLIDSNTSMYNADANGTATFTLKSGVGQLDSKTIKASATLVFSGDKNEEVQLVDADTNAMSYELRTYKANVLNLRSNATGTVNTYMKIYNNSDAETKVKATVTNPDGATVELADVVTIGKNSSETVSMSQLKTLNATIANGAQVDLTMPIDALKGDVVAFQNDSTNGKTGMRVVDNNQKTKGM
jgi:hypothetical protein